MARIKFPKIDELKNKEFLKIIYKLLGLFALMGAYYVDKTLFANKYVLITVTIIFYYVALNILFNTFNYIIISLYKLRSVSHSQYDLKFTIGIRKLTFMINNVVFFFVFLYILGINPFQFLTSISIVAVALVLIFRDFIVNLLNGISIMFSRNINIGDYVKISESKGRVTNITFQTIEIKTDSGDYVYVPNSMIQSKELINYSKESLKHICVITSLDRINFPKFKKIKLTIIKKLLEEFSEIILNENKIEVKISKFEKDIAQLVVEIEVNKYNFKLEEKIKAKVNDIIISLI